MSDQKRSLLSNLGVPAPAEQRADQLREMQGRLEKEEADRLAELARSEVASVEHDCKWKEHWESLGMG